MIMDIKMMCCDSTTCRAEIQAELNRLTAALALLDVTKLLDVCPHTNAEVSARKSGTRWQINWHWLDKGELRRYGRIIDLVNPDETYYGLERAKQDMQQVGVNNKTTDQMLEAPKNAYYVWPNGHLDYAFRLVKYLGRHDLRIISAERFFNEQLYKSAVYTIDHAVNPGDLIGIVRSRYAEMKMMERGV